MKTFILAILACASLLGGCASLYTDPFVANPEEALQATVDAIQKVLARGVHVCVSSLDGQDTIDMATLDGQTLAYQYTRLGDDETWRRHTVRGVGNPFLSLSNRT